MHCTRAKIDSISTGIQSGHFPIADAIVRMNAASAIKSMSVNMTPPK
jgi:hypothetical protein